MALTITSLKRTLLANKRLHTAKVQFDSSYATGGEALTAKMLGMRSIEQIQVASDSGYVFAYDYSNAKLLAYRTATLTPAGTIAVTMTDGSMVVSYAPGGGDIKGCTLAAADAQTVDQDAPVNYALLAAATLVSGGNTLAATVNPDVPRNVVITISNDSGGPLNLYVGATSFLVTGTDVNGNALTETITITNADGTKVLATGKARYAVGSKAFATVTNFVATNPPAATLKWSIGVGSKLGLPSALDAGAVADVLDISVKAARVAPSSTLTIAGGVDTTNNTVNVGTLADGDDVGVIYKTDYDGAAGTATFTGAATTAAALAEVGSGVNLSAVYARVEAVGF